MKKSNLILLSVMLFALVAQSAFAARTITGATLNGASSVTVPANTVVTAEVFVTTTNSGGKQWNSVSYQVEGQPVQCNDFEPDVNAVGSFSKSFSITAPADAGAYAVSFIAYQDDGCTGTGSNTLNLVDGLNVTNIIPEFTYVSALVGLSLVAGIYFINRKR